MLTHTTVAAPFASAAAPALACVVYTRDVYNLEATTSADILIEGIKLPPDRRINQGIMSAISCPNPLHIHPSR